MFWGIYFAFVLMNFCSLKIQNHLKFVQSKALNTIPGHMTDTEICHGLISHDDSKSEVELPYSRWVQTEIV